MKLYAAVLGVAYAVLIVVAVVAEGSPHHQRWRHCHATGLTWTEQDECAAAGMYRGE